MQLSEANAAQQARQALDGQNVYNNCCTLRIDYSKLSTLNVKYNNDKSRDYTNPTLPSGEMTLEQQLSLISAAAGAGQNHQVTTNPLGAMVPGGFPFLQSGNQLAFAQQALTGGKFLWWDANTAHPGELIHNAQISQTFSNKTFGLVLGVH